MFEKLFQGIVKINMSVMTHDEFNSSRKIQKKWESVFRDEPKESSSVYWDGMYGEIQHTVI